MWKCASCYGAANLRFAFPSDLSPDDLSLKARCSCLTALHCPLRVPARSTSTPDELLLEVQDPALREVTFVICDKLQIHKHQRMRRLIETAGYALRFFTGMPAGFEFEIGLKRGEHHLVPSEGIEPPAFWFEARRSIH
jgi:hypothetical protein